MARRARTYAVVTGAAVALHVATLHWLAAAPVLQGRLTAVLFLVVVLAAAAASLGRAKVVPHDRWAMTALGLSFLSYTAASLFFLGSNGAQLAAFLAQSHLLRIFFFAALSTSFVLEVRSIAPGTTVIFWLDVLISGLGLSCVLALGIAPFVFPPGGGHLPLAQLAYPMIELLILGGVLAAGGLYGHRETSLSGVLALLGLVLMLVTDCFFTRQIGRGSYVDGTILDAGWTAALALVGAVAFRPRRQVTFPRDREEWGSAAPIASAVIALVVLAVSLLAPVNLFSRVLAIPILLLALGRQWLSAAELKQAHAALRASEDRRRRVVLAADVALMTLDPWGVITSFEGAQAYGLGAASPAEALGRTVFELLPPDPEVNGPFRRSLDGEEAEVTIEADARVFTYRLAPTRDGDGAVVGVTAVGVETTQRVLLERRLRHDSTHDALTGLANRRLLEEESARAVARCQRRHRRLGLLFVDLDDFKTINDRFGHTAGDALLLTVGERLLGCTRAGDLVARLGGDEFAILCEDVTTEGLTVQAERLLAALREPVVLGGSAVTVSASIGVVVADAFAAGISALMHDGDVAMYAAKQKGKNCYELFDRDLGAWVGPAPAARV